MTMSSSHKNSIVGRLAERIARKAIAYESPFWLVMMLVISIFLAESFVMILLSFLPQIPVWLATALDGMLMLILISPILYFFVFHPLLHLVHERRQAEEALLLSQAGLEQRVKERTAGLNIANEKLQIEIAERKHAEEALRNSAEEYRQLMEEAAHGIILFDSLGNFVAANAKACEMLEYVKEELLRLNMADLIPGEEFVSHPPRWEEANAGRTVVSERSVRCKSGKLKHVETTTQKLADGRYQAFVRDVTARKAGEAELRKAVQHVAHEQLFLKLRAFLHGRSGAMNLNRLALFAENVDAVALHAGREHNNVNGDTDGGQATLTHVSAAGRFELAAEEYSTVVYPELVHIASLLKAADAESGRVNSPFEFRSKANSITEWSSVVRDSIVELLDFVRHDGVNGKDNSTSIKLIDAARKLQNEIDQVSGAFETTFICEVSRVVEACVLKYQSSTSGITIRFEGRTNGATAICNTSELSVVVSILLENAIEALMTASGTNGDTEKSVLVETRLRDSKMLIHVRDSGPGLPMDIVESIFQDGISTKGRNRGFGLSYARTCISKYGGKVYLDTSEKRGTCFAVELILA